jgi:hypothetical protein
VHKEQWKAKALVPICSKWLKELTITGKCEVGEFYHRQNLSRMEHKYMFVEQSHIPQDERRNDVILMDKVI